MKVRIHRTRVNMASFRDYIDVEDPTDGAGILVLIDPDPDELGWITLYWRSYAEDLGPEIYWPEPGDPE